VTQGETTGKSLILPPKEPSEHQAIAKSRKRESTLNAVKAKFEIAASPDDPFYKHADIIQVMGIGQKFSGTWHITKATHELNDGYKYTFECKRNAVNGSGKNSPGSVPFQSVLNGPVNKKIPINTKSPVSSVKIKSSLTNSEVPSAGGPG
jgi:hypothetical protein